MRPTRLLPIFALALLVGAPARAESYDVIIRHALIVDGTGAPAYRAPAEAVPAVLVTPAAAP